MWYTLLDRVNKMEDEEALGRLRDLLSERDVKKRRETIVTPLIPTGRPIHREGEFIAVLRQLLGDNDAIVRKWVVVTLGQIANEGAMDVIGLAVHDPDVEVRRAIPAAVLSCTNYFFDRNRAEGRERGESEKDIWWGQISILSKARDVFRQMLDDPIPEIRWMSEDGYADEKRAIEDIRAMS